MFPVMISSPAQARLPETSPVGAPAASFDFASFSFQVPIETSLAKHTAPATRQNALRDHAAESPG
jgi:hypothetical protein